MEDKLLKAKKIVDEMYKTPLGRSLLKNREITDNICERLNIYNSEIYCDISNYIYNKFKQKENTMKENNNLLKETSFEIHGPKNILKYDEDIVTKTIKEVINKEFKNIKIQAIRAEEGGVFYTIILSLIPEEDIENDLEGKRFYLNQAMGNFRGKFFGIMSSLLPVININTNSYRFTKNSNALEFGVTICLSHTNDREWVSGINKKLDDKKIKVYDDIMAKNKISEASTSNRSHGIKAMKLSLAIQEFKNGRMDRSMLNTAIKACGRNELEFYVIRSLNLGYDIDISDINADSKEKVYQAPTKKSAFPTHKNN